MQGRIACRRMQGCYEEALKLAKQAVKKHPESPGLYSEQAWLRFAQGSYEEAEKDFKTANRYKRGEPATYINVAWSMIRQQTPESYRQAATWCHDALQEAPDFAPAFGCLGIIAFKRGNLAEAEVYLQRSIRAVARKGFHAPRM